jgi:adenylate kinase
VNLILLGPPGAGKGTQAKNLCDKFNLCHLSTGDILRNEVTEQTGLGKQAKSIMDKGELVSNNIILEIIKKFVNENLSKYSGFLFDGFPRSAEQADMLDAILKDINVSINKVILLDVDQSILFNRIIKRKEEEGRKDDNEDILKSRLDVYFTQTQPLIDYYSKLKLLEKVDGTKEIIQVNQDINMIMEAI